MHGAMRRMSISTGQASAGGSGTSNELSNSTEAAPVVGGRLAIPADLPMVLTVLLEDRGRRHDRRRAPVPVHAHAVPDGHRMAPRVPSESSLPSSRTGICSAFSPLIFCAVMAGLVPAIHAFLRAIKEYVDARDISAFTRVFRRAMRGHDRLERPRADSMIVVVGGHVAVVMVIVGVRAVHG